jgi:MFS family permease
MSNEMRENLRHNFVVNILDAAFFGLGLGLASMVTVVPLFVHTLTDSTLLIGLIASMHTIGWQLPQLFTANYVTRLRRYKPMVMFMTIHERWPYFGLALVAALMMKMGNSLALVIVFLLLIWTSLGAGVTATAWQSMIGKIMPRERRGTFFGFQSGAANLLASGGAVLAGVLLERLPFPVNFAICFLLAGLAMVVSGLFLNQTKESAHVVETKSKQSEWLGWRTLIIILKRDKNFRWFLVARMLSQVAWMAVSFYTIYAVRRFNMGDQTAGVLTGVLLLSQTVANPILGWIGDRWGHRTVFAAGTLLVVMSAGLAMVAPNLGWFYVVFGLTGFSNVVVWTTAMSLTLEFGTEADRPLYIGLSNTLIAPVTILAPVVGGWLADAISFQATFMVSVVAGLLTSFVLQFVVLNPRESQPKIEMSQIQTPVGIEI